MNILTMIIFSILAGSLSTMNLWVARESDTRFHLNDVYMVLLMTAWMVFFDAVYNYKHHKNAILLVSASIASITTLIYFIRKQTFITDTQFMKGMIPHHSMAVEMAEQIKKKSTNKNVIDLASNIIRTQNAEIAYMKNLGY